jgi:hypothetical protein
LRIHPRRDREDEAPGHGPGNDGSEQRHRPTRRGQREQRQDDVGHDGQHDRLAERPRPDQHDRRPRRRELPDPVEPADSPRLGHLPRSAIRIAQ